MTLINQDGSLTRLVFASEEKLLVFKGFVLFVTAYFPCSSMTIRLSPQCHIQIIKHINQHKARVIS